MSDRDQVRVVVHVLNEDPFEAEMESPLADNATFVLLRNIRSREGRPVVWLPKPIKWCLFPLSRVGYIEALISDQEMSTANKWYRDPINQ
ncbi:MAG TPA: hypothetical protein VJN88_16980 [Ktedonobacterales bacterium]|nr:hypothetical protein [Ktedonobacterales bacterium]